MPAARTGWAPPHHPEVARALGLVRASLPLAAVRARFGDHGVIACSGGADSVALTGLLGLLSASEGFRLTVAHVDHGLREDSAADAAVVTSLATTVGLPVCHRRLSLVRGAGLPARARAHRQAALIEVARDAGAAWVALGHTQTDQAETVLLHLTRGAGTQGLGGMRAVTPWPADRPAHAPAGSTQAPAGSWWRPLLGLSRGQTRALVQRLELPFVDDPTNASRTAPRTLIRHEVLPRLATINPAVERALATAAGHAQRADEALSQWAHTELARRATGPADHTYGIADIGALPSEVRRRLFRAACQHAGILADALSAQTVADVDAAWVRRGPPRSWDLHPHARVHVAGDTFWVVPDRGVRGPNH